MAIVPFYYFGVLVVGEFIAALSSCYPFSCEWMEPRSRGKVGVVPVIGQYCGLGCFSIIEWPRQHCHCPRNLGSLCFHSLSCLQCHVKVLLYIVLTLECCSHVSNYTLR